MLRTLSTTWVIVAGAAMILAGCSNELPQKSETGRNSPGVQGAAARAAVSLSGEALFKQYCSSCHPNGGNVSDPDRPLYGSALRRNHITTPEDIVRIMRNPLSRMIRFDRETLSDKEAGAIAEYVLATFN
jgi:cytochrome c6